MHIPITLFVTLFSQLQTGNASDSNCNSPDKITCSKLGTANTEYKLYNSPVLWVNLGFVIWGLISFGPISSLLKNFCLLENLENRGKSISTPRFLVTAFLVNTSISIYILF